MRNLVAKVLVQTFEKEVGRNQKKAQTPKAMKASFALRLNENQDGSHILDLVLYAPDNYVQVLIRERIDVEENGVERQEIEAWLLVDYHDSGWRHSVEQVLRRYEDRITGFDFGHFYSVVNPLELEIR